MQVRSVDTPYRHNASCRAQLGDTVWIDVVNLDEWLSDPKVKSQIHNKAPSVSDLVPVLNGVRLTGVNPEYSDWDDDFIGGQLVKVCHLRFVLNRDEASKSAWSRLLNMPVLERPMGVSVALPESDELETHVLRGAPTPAQQFWLVVMPMRWLLIGSGLVLASLVAFLYLAAQTDIVRDPTSPLRPDGLRPFSLARAQMAFWFFLVIASYLFLWIITGDKDTITTSVLTLIGISAGTALGAAVVDAGKNPQPLTRVAVPPPRDSILTQLKSGLAEQRQKLAELQEQVSPIPPVDPARLEAVNTEREQVQASVSDLENRLAFFALPPWKAVMYDLLADDNSIGFHRFQIFIWTIVLGIIFSTNVYRELTMPEFSGTLLGLMGISAGTYIGFKMPEPRKV